MPDPHSDRIERARAAMATAGIDALLLTPGADLFYLTGFRHSHAGERLLALLLPREGAPIWLVPEMNAGQLPAGVPPGARVIAWSDGEWFHRSLAGALAEAGVATGRIAVDDEMRAGFLLDLLRVAPAARYEPASAVMRALRVQKDAAELAALRAAARSVDDTIAAAIALCRPGRREREVEAELRAALLRRSPEEEVAFSIVASGPNAALPHHETGDRRLARGDVVILDFGTRHDGYHSDITVTCAVGEPADPEVRRVYRVVWEAQQAALAAIRPGVPAEAVDAAARQAIAAAGYGAHFLHRTGHGIGLQVHEPPYLRAGNDAPLLPGMCFSVEPGVYLPGRFGVRLEVIACVTEDGAALLNAPSAPDLPMAPSD